MMAAKTTALSFTQLNLSSATKRWLENASSEQPKARGQQQCAAATFLAKESSGPPHKPKMKKQGTCANCAMTNNTATGSLWKWLTHESSN